jgi:hypothetical protein
MFTTSPHGFRRQLDPLDHVDGGPVRTDIGYDSRVVNPIDPRRSWARSRPLPPPKLPEPSPVDMAQPTLVGIVDAAAVAASTSPPEDADGKSRPVGVVVAVLVLFAVLFSE